MSFTWSASDGPTGWEMVSDRVMGGVSNGALSLEEVAGRTALRLTGTVSLENDGGFLQMARDMEPQPGLTAIRLTARAAPGPYEIRLRTSDLARPWQSFRATLDLAEEWRTLTIPAAALQPHRTEVTFDPANLTRLGIVAIGAAFEADLALADLTLM